jgi:hypothetical protein
MLPPHGPDELLRIRTSDWCRDRLHTVRDGLLSADEERRRRAPLPVACVADEEDVVFVVRERVEQTWSLVWGSVTIEVAGTAADGRRWVVRASGICERVRLPDWAAAAWARSSHPAFGNREEPAPPPFGLRLPDPALRGCSVLAEQAAG